MTRELRILMLEDAAEDAELAVRELSRAGLAFRHMRVHVREEYLKALHTFSPDTSCAISRCLPSMACRHSNLARHNAPDVPFIFVSGTIGEERAVEAIRRGATDYVLKNRLERLVPVVRRAIAEEEERRARRKAEQELAGARQRIDSIVSSLTAVVWSISISPYALIYINPAAESIFQRSLSELYADPDLWLAVAHPDDRNALLRNWAHALEGNSLDHEYRIISGAGHVRWIHNRAQAVFDDHGVLLRLDGLAQDITQRKAHEHKIARLSRIREVLREIGSAILRATSKSELFNEACRIAVRYGQFKMAWIGVADPDRRRLVPAERTSRRTTEDRRCRSCDDTCGPWRRPARSRRTEGIHLERYEHDSAVYFKAEARARGYRSLVVLPLSTATRWSP